MTLYTCILMKSLRSEGCLYRLGSDTFITKTYFSFNPIITTPYFLHFYDPSIILYFSSNFICCFFFSKDEALTGSLKLHVHQHKARISFRF